MKYFKALTILLFSSVIFFYGCKDNSKTAPRKITTPNPTALEPAQNANGVWHYICSNRCAGGSGFAGKCVTCGGTLVHNSIYHTNANSTPSTAPYTTGPYATPPVTTPGKNTKGIWHYSCEKGCVGGSGTEGTCGTCGTTLTHNSNYHE